jgi:hypothetical protein
MDWPPSVPKKEGAVRVPRIHFFRTLLLRKHESFRHLQPGDMVEPSELARSVHFKRFYPFHLGKDLMAHTRTGKSLWSPLKTPLSTGFLTDS